MTVPIIHLPHRSRRQRRPSLAATLAQAQRAGRDVKSATVGTTGDIRLEFGKPESEEGDTPEGIIKQL